MRLCLIIKHLLYQSTINHTSPQPFTPLTRDKLFLKPKTSTLVEMFSSIWTKHYQSRSIIMSSSWTKKKMFVPSQRSRKLTFWSNVYVCVYISNTIPCIIHAVINNLELCCIDQHVYVLTPGKQIDTLQARAVLTFWQLDKFSWSPFSSNSMFLSAVFQK